MHKHLDSEQIYLGHIFFFCSAGIELTPPSAADDCSDLTIMTYVFRRFGCIAWAVFTNQNEYFFFFFL